MRKGSGWMERVSGKSSVICRGCRKDVVSLPGEDCAFEAIHRAYRDRRMAVRKDMRTAERSRWQKRLKALELFGSKCKRCGETDTRVLQFNHVNGGGCRERANTGSDTFVRRLLSGSRKTDDLELLCANCNTIYEYEQGRRWCPPELVTC